jgi:ATP-GRASP peptide maturase of grasp-with-spasm system
LILVITHEFDQTGLAILRWLKHLGKTAYILTSNDSITLEMITHKTLRFKNHTRQYGFTLDEKTFIIYRQGKIPDFGNILIENTENAKTQFGVNENEEIKKFFYHLITRYKHLGQPDKANLNKLQVLNMAKQNDLTVPDFIYTYSKKEVELFYKKHSAVITKAIQPAVMIEQDAHLKAAYTQEILFQDIPFENELIYPTFFQALIVKKMDVRVFYMNGTYYANGIFSQSNKQTQLDYRRYDTTLPNRQIPIRLPENIIQSLVELFKQLKLNYGSADFIYGQDEKFYFLEINPVGQFGIVSYVNNSFIERQIAEMAS